MTTSPGDVTSVLLADGWHAVDQREDGTSTFDLVSEYALASAQWDRADREWTLPLGFAFVESGVYVSGSLRSLIAVRHLVLDTDADEVARDTAATSARLDREQREAEERKARRVARVDDAAVRLGRPDHG